MNRDRVTSIFLGGIVAGVILSWACGPQTPGAAHAQDNTSSTCAHWEILPIVVNTDAGEDINGFINEPVALGFPDAFAPGEVSGHAIPQTVDEAKIAMPDGWEPLGAYGNFFVARRCTG